MILLFLIFCIAFAAFGCFRSNLSNLAFFSFLNASFSFFHLITIPDLQKRQSFFFFQIWIFFHHFSCLWRKLQWKFEPLITVIKICETEYLRLDQVKFVEKLKWYDQLNRPSNALKVTFYKLPFFLTWILCPIFPKRFFLPTK